MSPLRGLQETRVATREESGVLGFPPETRPDSPGEPGGLPSMGSHRVGHDCSGESGLFSKESKGLHSPLESRRVCPGAHCVAYSE